MSDTSAQYEFVAQATAFLEKIVMGNNKPDDAPGHLLAIEGFERLCRLLYMIKGVLNHFSIGQFDCEVELRGSMAGYLKALQSNIRHLVWQCKAVAAGDFDQKVDYLGELSEAFNGMTQGLIKQNKIIQNKHAELIRLAGELQCEVAKKEAMAAALKASEEVYREKSWRDSNTGLYNRDYFFQAVSLELKNIKRRQAGYFCLLMIDIDHFKRFNDTYGHLLGDKVILAVATTLTETLRKSDLCCRYGGEEFATFLSHATLEQGKNIAEKIRFNIVNQASPANNVSVPVTVSIGLSFVDINLLSCYDQVSDVLTKALEAADSALYAAKQNGRNQIQVGFMEEGVKTGESVEV